LSSATFYFVQILSTCTIAAVFQERGPKLNSFVFSVSQEKIVIFTTHILNNSCLNMATKRRTFLLILRSYLHIFQKNSITFNSIMTDVGENLILFLFVTFEFTSDE